MQHPKSDVMARLTRYVPYLIAAVIATNGFLTLATGLGEIFQFRFYLQEEVGEVSKYIHAAPSPQLGGFVLVALGALLIAVGKGLAERQRRSWWWALGILGLVLVNNLYQGLPYRDSVLSGLLLVLLLGFRGEFQQRPERRAWSYGELVAAVSVLFALAYGIVGSYLLRREFATIESWTDAVYFTIVTYSTLGYGDILPTTANTRIFTISMVFIGLSSFVTALTVLLGPLIETRMKGVFSVMSRIQKTVDHVVICGYTHVTESIVAELRQRHTPFILVEDREDMLAFLKGRGYDVLTGDPTTRAVLEQANLPRAAAVIAATDSDATNTLVALTARGLREEGEPHRFRILVRIEDEENIEKVRHIGVDEVISPSTLGGRLMASRALGDEASVEE